MSSSVVMISLQLSLTLSSAGISAHSAPQIMPATIIAGIISQPEPSQPVITTAVAPQAPMCSWPSAPMFQNSILKASITPRPQRISGVALTSTSAKP